MIGEPNSYVFGSILDGVFEGKIITERDAYYVEHAKRYFPTNFTTKIDKRKQAEQLELRSLEQQQQSLGLHNETQARTRTSTAIPESTTAASVSSSNATAMHNPHHHAKQQQHKNAKKSASSRLEQHHDDVIKTIGFHSVIYKDAHADDAYKDVREGKWNL